MILALGVDDIPYDDGDVTTFEVAGFLEEKYGVMQVFADQNIQFIADKLRDSLQGTLEQVIAGIGSIDANPFAEGTESIQQRFREYIEQEEIAKSGVIGVPTQAALDGKSKRFKGGKAGGRRPSFIDTGLYESHFRAWVADA